MTEKQRSILLAIILILLGLWFLAQNIGLPLPNLGQLWPAIIIIGGFQSLWTHYRGEGSDPSGIFVGISAIQTGLFFFLFTLNVWIPVFGRVSWASMAELWPAFIVIGAIAFIAQFILSGFKEINILIVGILALAIGIGCFAFTLGFFSMILGRQLFKFWPVILILIGLGSLAGNYLKRN